MVDEPDTLSSNGNCPAQVKTGLEWATVSIRAFSRAFSVPIFPNGVAYLALSSSRLMPP